MDLAWITAPLSIAVAVAAIVIWLNRTLDPRLLIEDAVGEPKAIAAYLPSMIADELHQLRREGSGSSLTMAAGPDEPIALPETVLAQESFKLVAWVLALLPRPTHVFHIQLIPSGPQGGPGLAVALSASGRQRAAAVLWDREYAPGAAQPASTGTSAAVVPSAEREEVRADTSASAEVGADGDEGPPAPGGAGDGENTLVTPEPTGGFHRLAMAACAWLAYQLPTNDPRGRDHALLSDDWRSYAQFRVAAVDGAGRREAYLQALKYDPRNRGALHNLAVLDGQAQCYGPALHRLSATVALLGDDGRERDRLWYRARFNLAVAAINYVLDARRGHPLQPECVPPPPADRHALVKMAIQALEEIETTGTVVIAAILNEQALTRQGTRTNSGLLSFLREIRELAEVTRADAEALNRVPA